MYACCRYAKLRRSEVSDVVGVCVRCMYVYCVSVFCAHVTLTVNIPPAGAGKL